MRTLRLTYHIRVIIQTRHGTMAGKTCEKTPAGVWPHSFGILGLNVRRTRCMALEISDTSHFRTLTQTLASIGNAFTVTLLYPGIIDAAERNPYQAGNFNLSISSTYHHHPLGSSLDYSRSLRLFLPLLSRILLSFRIASTSLPCHGRRPPSR